MSSKPNVPTLHAAHGASEPPAPKGQRAPAGEGETITIDLKDFPDILAAIRKAAAEDDRKVSVWTRRYVVRKLQEDMAKTDTRDAK